MNSIPLARFTPRIEPRLLRVPLPLLGLYLLALPFLVWRLGAAPAFWFDEGFRANLAYVFATTGDYATSDHDALRPFDPATSTGPADTLPVAALYAAFGPGIWQSRVPGVAYALLGLTAAYLLGRWFMGWQAGLLAGLMVLAAPVVGDTGYVLLGRQLMGEVPAIALILIGLRLWFELWDRSAAREPLWRTALPGLIVGLGLLSKTQAVFGLLPGLTLVVLARAWVFRRHGRRGLVRVFTPWVALLAVVGAWQTLGRLSVDPVRQAEYAEMLRVTVSTNLLTGLVGRTLSPNAWAMFAFMLIVAVLALIAVLRHRPSRWTARDWALLTLALVVSAHALWFAFVSIGWVRYAFTGWIVAWLILSIGATRWLHQPGVSLWPWRLAASALAVLSVVNNGFALAGAWHDSKVEEAAAYLRTHVPASAVIESWEWELDALIGRTDISHPGQVDQMDAIRRVFYPAGGPAPAYDTLRNDPDYLVVGRMAGYTCIYPADVIEREFVLEVAIGDYDIYRRLR